MSPLRHSSMCFNFATEDALLWNFKVKLRENASVTPAVSAVSPVTNACSANNYLGCNVTQIHKTHVLQFPVARQTKRWESVLWLLQRNKLDAPPIVTSIPCHWLGSQVIDPLIVERVVMWWMCWATCSKQPRVCDAAGCVYVAGKINGDPDRRISPGFGALWKPAHCLLTGKASLESRLSPLAVMRWDKWGLCSFASYFLIQLKHPQCRLNAVFYFGPWF